MNYDDMVTREERVGKKDIAREIAENMDLDIILDEARESGY